MLLLGFCVAALPMTRVGGLDWTKAAMCRVRSWRDGTELSSDRIGGGGLAKTGCVGGINGGEGWPVRPFGYAPLLHDG